MTTTTTPLQAAKHVVMAVAAAATADVATTVAVAAVAAAIGRDNRVVVNPVNKNIALLSDRDTLSKIAKRSFFGPPKRVVAMTQNNLSCMSRRTTHSKRTKSQNKTFLN